MPGVHDGAPTYDMPAHPGQEPAGGEVPDYIGRHRAEGQELAIPASKEVELYGARQSSPDAGSEVAVVAGGEVAAVSTGAELAVVTGAEVAVDGPAPEWYMTPGVEVARPFNGVFLGATPNRNGWGQTHRDSAETPTPDGFTFGISQNSAGFTGTYARPTEGHTLEALRVDEVTGLPIWESTIPELEDMVRVSADYGRLVTEPETPWKDNIREGFGNPGAQVGIIRVTGPDGAVKYFAMGAEFEGREDAWRVEGSYAEVFVHNPDALDYMESNRTKALEAADAAEAAKPQPRPEFEDDFYTDNVGNRISPDPLAAERLAAKQQAESLVDDLHARLPELVASGRVVESTNQWDQQRGLRSYAFAQPVEMPDGRLATMELEVPAEDGQTKDGWGAWGVRVKMGRNEGNRIGDRGYSQLDIRVILPNERVSERRVSVSSHTSASGWSRNNSLEQRNANSMYSEVNTVAGDLKDADGLLRAPGLLGEQVAVAA